MNRDFVQAMQQLALERGVSTEEILEAFKEALRKAYIKRQKGYKKEEVDAGKGPEVDVYIDPQTGRIEMVEVRRVVEKVEDPDKEIALAEALEYDPEVQVGDEMEFPIDPEGLSRMAIQDLRQILTQRLKESERNRIYNEYKDKEGQVLTGVVTRVDNRGNVFVDLGRGEAYLQERADPHRALLPRTAPQGLPQEGGPLRQGPLPHREPGPRGAFEAPPEAGGARDRRGHRGDQGRGPGAGAAEQGGGDEHNPNVDPIGACIGHKGQRIQAVSAELGREKVDIILWSKDPKEFIKNALSPAQVGSIELDPEPRRPR